MLEIIKRKLVITRKAHECYGCLKEIEKGTSAISVSAQEDERYKNIHLHRNCNSIINQHKHDVPLTKGCVTEELLKSAKIHCYWCVTEIKEGGSVYMGYGKFGAMYFCSEECKTEERQCPF